MELVVMLVIALVTAAAVTIFRKAPPAGPAPAARGGEDEREKWLKAAVKTAKGLKIAPRSSVWVHRPVYDCGSDEYQMPCAHEGFDAGAAGDWQRRGWIRSFGEIEELLKGLSLSAAPDAQGRRSVACVGMGDHVVLLSASHLDQPGATATRIVRLGESEWYSWRWATGARPAEEDPPFYVHEVAAEPMLWARREAELRLEQVENQNFRAAAMKCKHRA